MVDPSVSHQKARRENNRNLPKVFAGNEIPSRMAYGVSGGKHRRHRARILQIVSVAEEMGNGSVGPLRVSDRLCGFGRCDGIDEWNDFCAIFFQPGHPRAQKRFVRQVVKSFFAYRLGLFIQDFGRNGCDVNLFS